jgi:hypothetical protein
VALEDEAAHEARQPHRRGPQRQLALHSDAGQGESNIRRWIIENDWLEATVALPLNTGDIGDVVDYVDLLLARLRFLENAQLRSPPAPLLSTLESASYSS